jgi:hypothetical protein
MSLPVNDPRGSMLLQVLPTGCTVTATLAVLVPHVAIAEEKAGTKLVLPGTLHATWLSAVGAAAEVKVQVEPLLHGRGPLTAKLEPPKRY